ncbi:hypothetical protein BVC80_1173g3 [Macleaya cordata]|uniref:Uncharacterized protein n=1 Tax=Macleaya cordata TaxID=56857 RepID=A0A200QIA8_MACCD|nr:hypothetical protein BVC80_1173g3 [Macleaya cordata]
MVLPSNITTTTTTSFSKMQNNIDIEQEKSIDIDIDIDINANNGYCTPKAQRFQIPKIESCPPAPKKQRLVSYCSSSSRAPIPFFASPDIELFFYSFALN